MCPRSSTGFLFPAPTKSTCKWSPKSTERWNLLWPPNPSNLRASNCPRRSTAVLLSEGDSISTIWRMLSMICGSRAWKRFRNSDATAGSAFTVFFGTTFFFVAARFMKLLKSVDGSVEVQRYSIIFALPGCGTYGHHSEYDRIENGGENFAR